MKPNVGNNLVTNKFKIETHSLPLDDLERTDKMYTKQNTIDQACNALRIKMDATLTEGRGYAVVISTRFDLITKDLFEEDI